jgi:hypothetical protein
MFLLNKVDEYQPYFFSDLKKRSKIVLVKFIQDAMTRI